jgi:3-oxoacyl-[acyl-carrier-protein] synthase III
VIGSANGAGVSITGLACQAPERVMTNDELAQMMDTSDEWIRERTGIRERRVAREDETLADVCMPACLAALERAGVQAKDVDLLIVATVTADMAFPSTGAVLADRLGARDAAAYDLAAGCTGFVYAIAQAHSMLASGLSRCALVVGADLLSKIVDWTDRSTAVLFGDGAGAAVLERVGRPGFLAFELGADGSGGVHLYQGKNGMVQMNGREVFKFATRVLVASAQAVLDETGKTIDDVDVYVPHQANMRIIDHAAGKLGVPKEKVMINVDRYGNTSSASIPLALAEAVEQGRIKEGDTVLMTRMGAGLTWGSALIDWTAAAA